MPAWTTYIDSITSGAAPLVILTDWLAALKR